MFLMLLRPICCEKLKRAPPQTIKFEITAEKSVSISVKTFFFEDHLILGGKKFELEISAEKSVSISVKTVFLFRRSADFGRKKRLNVRFRPKNQSQFR